MPTNRVIGLMLIELNVFYFPVIVLLSFDILIARGDCSRCPDVSL